jgi:hypothetical protein
MKPDCFVNLIVVGDSTNEMKAGLELHEHLSGFSDTVSHQTVIPQQPECRRSIIKQIKLSPQP